MQGCKPYLKSRCSALKAMFKSVIYLPVQAQGRGYQPGQRGGRQQRRQPPCRMCSRIQCADHQGRTLSHNNNPQNNQQQQQSHISNYTATTTRRQSHSNQQQQQSHQQQQNDSQCSVRTNTKTQATVTPRPKTPTSNSDATSKDTNEQQ